MTYNEAAQEQIDEIMDTFDFGRIAAWMKHANWQWGDDGVPDEALLRLKARELLRRVVKEGGKLAGGGFLVERQIGEKDEDDPQGRPFVRLSLAFGYQTFIDGTNYDV